MENNKKIYFASDFHLGVDVKLTSRDREKLIVKWLDSIKNDASEIYILGDVFDFYFEYKTVVPKGNVRLLGKLAEISDSGIPIYFFTGNHDMWIFNYFEDELGIKTYRKPIKKEILGKTFFLGHGDGLGPGDKGYKFIKKVFANRFAQWLFERLHPNFGIGLANFWSNSSRNNHKVDESKFLGEEKVWVIQFCNEKLHVEPEIDFFIFGHRHLLIDHVLENGKSRYINTGEWMVKPSYAVFDGVELRIKYYEL